MKRSDRTWTGSGVPRLSGRDFEWRSTLRWMGDGSPLWRRLVPEQQFHQNRYVELLERIVRSGIRWLDLGAGASLHDGWIGASPQEFNMKAATLLGCDLSQDSLIHNECVDIRVVADAKRLPLRPSCIDLVSANMVLEHLPEPEPVFREVSRVLRPGGYFVCITPNLLHPVFFVSRVLLTRNMRRSLAHALEGRAFSDIFPTFYRANTTSKLRCLARSSGLTPKILSAFFSTPLIRGAGPVTLLEAFAIRLAPKFLSCRIGSNILALFRKG